MNATEKLIEAVQGYFDERANPAMDAGQRSYWRRAMEKALAAAKEEQARAKPVAWMWRWTNPANDPSARPWETAWKHLTIADCAAGQTLDNKIAELRGYVSDNGVAQYEVIPVYTHPPTKGLDVEGVMRLVEEHLEPMATEILGHYIISGKSRLRKALEERLTK